MKRLVVILLALLLTFGLFANAEQKKDTPPAGPREVNLTMGVFGDLESAYLAVFGSADFKAKFPNVTIEIQTADIGGHHDRLVTQIAAGTGANDFEALEIGYIARFVQDGGFTDLAPAPFNGNEAGKDLVPFGMSNATTRDGKLIALPVDIAPAVMFYRKDICDDLGVDMTNLSGWEEYIEKGKKLVLDKDGDGIIDQYALTHPNDLAMIPLNGGKGDWFDESGEPFSPKQRFLNVLTLVKAVREAGIDANFNPWSGEWIDGFKQNKVATMFAGAWLGGHFKNWMCPELAGKWRVDFPPGKIYASDGGSYIGIPEQTAEEKKADCWEVIKYLCTSPEAQLLSFRTTDAFPALTTVFSDPVMEEPVDYFGGQRVRLIYQEIGLNIPIQEVTEYDVIAKDIFNKAIGSVITDAIPVEEAYEEAKAELESMI